MAYQLIKQKLLDIYRWEMLPRLEALHAEQVYQGIFAHQCTRFGVREVFYPVGAAASFSLMYLLTRILTELPVRRIVELGSGESTVLIDRLRKADDGMHLAYDQSEFWVQRVAARAPGCQVRHAPIVAKSFEGVSFSGYYGLEPVDFDLLLVDGPNGTDRVSRYDCVPLVAANRAAEFVIIVDDASRPGETETIAALTAVLQRRGVAHKLNYISGRTTQAVITTAGYRAASYFF
jgi:hypothetical protein